MQPVRLATCGVLPRRTWADESGQNVVEYGLLIATIVVVVLLAITAFGEQIAPWFASLAGRITTT
jgi:Flp pilus assembly pilin Flp